MASIRIENLCKTYKGGQARAVDNVSLEIKDKEFVILVGPSGCGKSTTLRMVAGLEEVTAGNIWIGDRLVNDVPPKDRDIAMVFQNYALYPHMTVFENMAFGLKLRGYPKPEVEKRVLEAAEILNIREYLKRRPRQLSGGERQRVALGRAIVRKPKVFLFDEPLSNLDARMRVTMRTEIHKLRQRLQTTFIYVTHDQTEAMTMGDRIVVMKSGVIQQVAEPMTIYDKPANKFVASFIGTPPINLMRGTVLQKDKKFYFDEGQFRVRIVDEMSAALAPYAGQEVVLGIRSEDIYDRLFVSESTPENTIRVACEFVEPLGAEVFLYLNSGKNNFMARVGAHNRPEVNKDMEVVFDMSKVHFFDPKTETTLI
ncbi:MAG: sn-glycerol-3-phosphate ABC transporter ATP-binding protein UgpC [Candidatus Omnitrophica bacterium]|nr:sn-glycerol-3-phosphate ABC transporter ATP-binding protein UgpC [Candidatus Omnitrophota bacterium]